MNDQSMMLGVPAGTEPVSERSLEEKPPVPEKPKRKRTVSGRIIATIDNEIYKVEMNETGLTVRRSCKHHVDVKPMREIVDFVTGQGRLPLDVPQQDFAKANEAAQEDAAFRHRSELLECVVEFIACQMAESNNPGKHTGRYRLAASALREQVETLAKGRIQEVLKSL